LLRACGSGLALALASSASWGCPPADSGDGDGPDRLGAAELLVSGGRIWTADAAAPWAEALAVRAGELVYVGDAAGAEAWGGPETRRVDASGRLLVPGFHDVHVHALEAGSPVFTCVVSAWSTAEALVPEIAACAEEPNPTGWVLGWGQSVYALLEASRRPAEILDEAVPDVPAAFLDWTAHSLWVNSLALAAAGIVDSTPDPPGGVIVRDPASGEATGLLFDNAGDVLLDGVLTPTPELDELHYEGLLWSLDRLAENGITSIADARMNLARNHDLIWRRADDEGRLSVRTTLGVYAHPEFDDDAQIAEIAGLFDAGSDGSRLRVTEVKLFADGLISNSSAALLLPYLSDLGVGDGRGLLFWGTERMARYIAELEQVGFDAHVHAIGDRAVRSTLDAVAAAIGKNGPGIERRHRITHAELVHPDDVPRFAELGVVADLQTAGDWILPEWEYEEAWLLGTERIDAEWFRLRDLYDAGARVVTSSDWDVSTLSPLPRLQYALALGAQGLPDLDAALRATTIDAAWVLRQEELTGSLEEGKRADFAVIDRDLFEVPIEETGAAKVLLTVLDGEETFRDPEFGP
jgi:predicted amidohydrolase YtcJ